MKTAYIINAIGETWYCLIDYDQDTIDSYRKQGFSIIIRYH